jgi:two-component system, NarL family, invasion response regulator UvrY
MHSVALIDDHHLVRSGLVNMVNSVGGYRVTLEAGNGKEFMRALSGAEEPAIAIVDLHMPVMDGFETIAWLKQYMPTVRPLALTFDASDEVMVRAVRAGARGFLLKNAKPSVLKVALDSLMLTGYYHSDELHATLVEKQSLKTPHERQQERMLAQITPRELEFLKLVCAPEEYTYEQIADRMGVHRRTVDGFREGLVEKFNIKSKTGLVLFAMKWGIVKP